MARALLVGTGVVATLAGALLLAGGGAVAATFGSDGRVSTEPATVVGTGAAVLVEGFSVDATGLPVPAGVGALTLTASSPDGAPIFLGTAPDDALDAYLTGVPYDVVASLSPGATATTRPVPGTLRPQPPTDADLWTSQSVGAPARLPARVPDGTTLVVMRPDGDDGVTASLVVTLEVDRAWPAALIALGAGLVLLVLGVVLLAFGLRRAPAGAHAASPAVAVTTAAPPVTPAAVAPVVPDDPPTSETEAAVDDAPAEADPEPVVAEPAVEPDVVAAEPGAVGSEDAPVDTADAAPSETGSAPPGA